VEDAFREADGGFGALAAMLGAKNLISIPKTFKPYVLNPEA
jgi:hypothetical protein